MLAYSLGKAADKHLYFSGFGPGPTIGVLGVSCLEREIITTMIFDDFSVFPFARAQATRHTRQ